MQVKGARAVRSKDRLVAEKRSVASLIQPMPARISTIHSIQISVMSGQLGPKEIRFS